MNTANHEESEPMPLHDLRRQSDWSSRGQYDQGRIVAEIEAIHRENSRRDKIVESMARDVKELLALANKSRGGLWVGMAISGSLGSAITFLITNFKH